MVGVPGRSKGCNTCRKRKIACSLERPECFQCVKSGRQCLGYQKERVFVTSAPSTKGYESAWRPDTYSRPVANKPVNEETHPIRQLDVSRWTTIGIHTGALSKTAWRQQMLASYISDKQPRWISLIPGIVQPTRALELATYAVCSARLGRRSEDPDHSPLIREGNKLYGQALEATRRALSDPKLLYDDQTLGACLLLGVYEIFECPSNSRSGYLKHFEGCGKLVELRGPERHRTGIGHAIFLSFRLMGALEALLRKETFLSKPEWKTVPFADVEATPFDHLLDQILEAPDIMGLADGLQKMKTPEEQLERAKEICRLCWQFDSDIQRFYSDMEASANGPMFWPVFSEDRSRICDPEDEEELFPVVYHFIEPRLGNTVIFYWAVLLILYSGMNQLYGLFDQLGAALDVKEGDGASPGQKTDFAVSLGFPPLEHRKDIRPVARNICQCVEYCTMDDLGASIVTGPLNILINILSQWGNEYEREIEWTQRALNRLRDRGVGIVDHLPRNV